MRYASLAWGYGRSYNKANGIHVNTQCHLHVLHSCGLLIRTTTYSKYTWQIHSKVLSLFSFT